MQNNASQEEVTLDTSTDVNLKFWYGEDDNLLILAALLRQNKLILSNGNNGIVFNNKNELYVNDNFSYTVGFDLALDVSLIDQSSKFDQLANAVKHILAWNNNSGGQIRSHRMLLPLNIQNVHWCLLVIDFDLIAMNNEFVIDQYIKLSVVDSLPNLEINGPNLKQLIYDIFCKYNSASMSLIVKGSIYRCKQQPDSHSCGPITLYHLMNMLLGIDKNQNDNQPFTIDEIREIRYKHLLAVNQHVFTTKQKQYTPTVLQGKNIDPIHSLTTAIKLNAFIVDKLADEQKTVIYKNMATLIAKDKQLEGLNNTVMYNSEENLDGLFVLLGGLNAEHQASLKNITSFFNEHYQDLIEIIPEFFKLKTDPQAIGELQWADKGVDQLIAVLKRVEAIHRQTSQATQINENFISELNLNTYFDGELDVNNAPKCGKIRCFLGQPDRVPNLILLYEGKIEQGLLNGNANVLVYSKQHCKFIYKVLLDIEYGYIISINCKRADDSDIQKDAIENISAFIKKYISIFGQDFVLDTEVQSVQPPSHKKKFILS